MLAAPTEAFDVPIWIEAKVHPDHHVSALKALYSVPTAHLHKRARIRIDSKLVRIYIATELVKIHPRQDPGGRSTDANDYPVGKSAYALRSVDKIIGKAKEHGEHIGRFVEALLGGPIPFTQMRAAYALLSLCEKYGDGPVEAVCQTSLSFDSIDVRRIGRMLKLGLGRRPKSQDGKVVQLPLPMPPARFARSDDHFRTRTKKEAT